MFRKLIDFIYPPFCIICKKKLDFFGKIKICKICYKNLPWINPNTSCEICGRFLNNRKKHQNKCNVCQNDNIFFHHGFSLFNFFAPLKTELYNIKYKGDFTHISTFSEILANRLKKMDFLKNFSISYVSLHISREKGRGFNQSKLIAEHVSKKINIPIKKLLLRKKLTPPQASLNFKERKINIKDSFSINPLIKNIPEDIILIDDVITSGNTLNECSKVLIEKGAKNIFIATLFSVPDEF